ncbi:MAG: copper chaperone PCu(A)C [Sphingomonadales bacterium]|nr:copper chaperone PCu(A)C [Sphingomonadales bacterium]
MRHFVLMPMLLAVAGCQQAAPKAASVDSAWVRLPAVAGRPGAAYFTIHGGAVEDRLMEVGSPQAIRTEMHDMSMDGGVMKMAAIEGGLAVPAKGEVAFTSGGKHVMLFDISPQALPGGKMTLTFIMASGQKLETEAAVVAAGDEEPKAL